MKLYSGVNSGHSMQEMSTLSSCSSPDCLCDGDIVEEVRVNVCQVDGGRRGPREVEGAAH